MKKNDNFKTTIRIALSALLLPFVFSACSGNSSGSEFTPSIIDPDENDGSASENEIPVTEGDGEQSGTEGDIVDTDGDAVADDTDNCPDVSNADQSDLDGDLNGDSCDDDDDGDAVADVDDALPEDATESADADGDTIGDNSDNCPAVSNAEQADLDGDSNGDSCDDDDDGDAVADTDDVFPEDATESADTDGDTVGDNSDNCPAVSNAEQADLDGDLSGDSCDDDDDGDAVADTDDAFPEDATESADADSDTVGDNADNCPAVSNADQVDLDGDLSGDSCDDDADGDGYLASADDCDDADDETHPGATEIFNFNDDDCDGAGDTAFSLADSEFYLTGDAAGDNLGYATASAGDVNGDGYGDFMIGAPYNDDAGRNAGKVFLTFGSPDLSGEFDATADGMTITGETAGDYAGIAISSAGDVNGDGYGDILIGATLNDDGGASAGKAYLVYGRDFEAGEEISLADADASFVGENDSDNLGVSVGGLGDIDADGYADIVMGASGYDNGTDDTGAGKAYVFLGGALSGTYDLSAGGEDVAFIGETGADAAGKTVAGAGDVNGDGRADILIGAPQNDAGGSNAGKVYLILGVDGLSGTLDLADADAAYVGETASDLAGAAIAGGADVNGDGYADILIGAYDNDSGGSGAGKAYVIFGGTTPASADLSAAGASVSGVAASDRMGFALTAAGDMDGDGDSEILVGAYKNDTGGADAGKIYIIKGRTDLTGEISPGNADAAFIGENAGDQSGYSVAAMDANGDGLSDVLIGANGYDLNSGLNGGKFYLLFVH